MSDATPTEEGNRWPSLGGRLEAVCDRFEAAWKAGRRPRIEDHLGASARARCGPPSSASCWCWSWPTVAGPASGRRRRNTASRFPEHAELIEAVFSEPTAFHGDGTDQSAHPTGGRR